jgi:hypothetical protein
MEYRGIRYTVRARIEREQWSVAIHPAGVELASKIISGPRDSAELQAHSMIKRSINQARLLQHGENQVRTRIILIESNPVLDFAIDQSEMPRPDYVALAG